MLQNEHKTTFLIIPCKALSSLKDRKKIENLLRTFEFSKKMTAYCVKA